MFEVLHSLRLARFRFTIEAVGELQLPDYKGSALRGGFGHAFKRATCQSREGRCGQCMLQSACAYATIFNATVSSETSRLLRIGVNAPQPFILEPPLTGERCFPDGSQLSYGLTLIGSAIEKLPFFVNAFTILGDELGLGRGHGRYRLVSIHDDTGKELLSGNRLSNDFRIIEAYTLLNSEPQEDIPLVLEFLTPTRLKTTWQRQNRGLIIGISSSADFRVLLKSLYHRAFVLTQLYAPTGSPVRYDGRDVPLTDEEVRLDGADTRWQDWTRYSSRQQQCMQLGGMIGKATFVGATGKFLPLFRLGEYLHLGKGTTFGLGMYRFARTSPDLDNE